MSYRKEFFQVCFIGAFEESEEISVQDIDKNGLFLAERID